MLSHRFFNRDAVDFRYQKSMKKRQKTLQTCSDFLDRFLEGLGNRFGTYLGRVWGSKIEETWVGREVGREGEESEAD